MFLMLVFYDCFQLQQLNTSFRIHLAVGIAMHFTLVTLKASHLLMYFEILSQHNLALDGVLEVCAQPLCFPYTCAHTHHYNGVSSTKLMV